MEKFITQCFGVDISKLDFTVCCAKRTLSGENRLSKTEKFENSKQGFNQFLKWSMKLGDPGLKTLFLMEATGVYYEPLAYHLHKLKKNVCVILPNKVKHYAKSLNIKTKTDAVDSRIIAQLGVEREHLLWAPPLEIFKTLRALTRLYTDLKQEVTVFSNRNESLEFGEGTNTFILATNRRILNELEKQIERCKEEIRRTIESETWLEGKVKKLQTIKGVGFITIAVIIAETQGFALIKNRKQLASYAGYDVVQRESGTSIKGKTRISKKGNSRIRACLHFPAMVASRHNSEMKEDYLRIIENKPNKMVGMTALQRKLLLLIYTLWKNGEVYQPDKLKPDNMQVKLS